MIEYLGYSPETRAEIIRIPQRVSEAIAAIADALNNTDEEEEIDFRPFEWLLFALASMSKAELYQAIQKIDAMSSVFSSPETSPNLKSAIGKLEAIFNK